MDYQVGKQLYGFTVTRVREEKELSGSLVEMIHDKTGAQLCFVQNGASNKLFCIGFKTPPENSTGIFHILEHSVLCGSDKYPVREPFVELMKSSMNTFLNAITYSDKTIYPVSSRNEQDFLNLTEVYLDAVFAPRLQSDPNIFYQEGWHLEQDADGNFSYKGVVFNEMKGATSDPDDIVMEKLMELLFPDSCYRFNSGGDPTVIPSLSYEQFVAAYRRHYHPSNSRIFLDGDVPMEKTLPLIASYLDRYEKETDLPTISMQTPCRAEDTVSYEVADENDLDNKERLTVGKILCDWKDRVTILAAHVISMYLTDTNDSPLSRAILSAGLGEQVGTFLDSSVIQPYFAVDVKNIPDGQSKKLLALMRETVAKMLENGLDRDALDACINRLEFRMREPDEPQALDRCDAAFRSWLHGGDPMQYLTLNEVFGNLRKFLAEGGFEALLQRLFLSDEGLAILHALPSAERGTKLRQAENERIAETVKDWGEDEKEANRRMNENLLAWQSTPDTPAQLATLPLLDLKEISPVPPQPTPTEVSEQEGVTVLTHTIPTGGVLHLRLYFSLTDCTGAEMTSLSFGGGLFGQLPTANYSVNELQQLLKRYVGRMDFGFQVSTPKDRSDLCTPMFLVSMSVLPENLPKGLELMREILFTTDFSQQALIKELLLQEDDDCKQLGVTSGHRVAISNVLSHYSAANAMNDMQNGYPYVRYIHGFTKQFSTEFESNRAIWERLQKKSFCRRRLTLSITSDTPVNPEPILALFPEGTAVDAYTTYAGTMPLKTAFRIPAQIGYTAQSYFGEDCRSDGKQAVAANYLSLDYLWNTVRVQGGAYGTGMTIGRKGAIYTYSYRDPTPVRSLEINLALAERLRSFCESEEAPDKYIISTVASTEPLRSPRHMGSAADLQWQNGYTESDTVKERAEMLGTTKESLKELIPLLEKFAAEGASCVVGYDAMVKQVEQDGYTLFDL